MVFDLLALRCFMKLDHSLFFYSLWLGCNWIVSCSFIPCGWDEASQVDVCLSPPPPVPFLPLPFLSPHSSPSSEPSVDVDGTLLIPCGMSQYQVESFIAFEEGRASRAAELAQQ